jgi:hypothetical protein
MEGSTNAELLGNLKELLTELQHRLANYVEAAGESPDVADEGLVLAVKAYKILGDAQCALWSKPPSIHDSKRVLEEVAARA